MRRVPEEMQSEQSECGLASLAMITGTYAKTLDLITLRQLFPDRGAGVSLHNLAAFAQQLGFSARGLKAEPEQLKRLTTPAILHWDMNHFIVLVAVKRRGLLIHDPARGRIFCGWQEVDIRFTGIALEVFPTAGFDPRKFSGRGATLKMRHLWQLVRGSGRNLAWVIVLSVVLQVLLVAGPWHMQWTVDEAVMTGDEQLVWVLASGFTLLLLLRSAVHWLRSIVVAHLGYNLSYLFASRLLSHLLSLPLQWFEKRRVGDVQSRFASLAPVQDFFTQGAAGMLVDGIIVVFSLVVMLLYSPLLALVVAVLQLTFVAVYLALVPRLKSQQMSIITSEAQEQSHILEAVRAIHSVKVYAQENHRLQMWQRLHARTIEHGLDHARLNIHIGTVGMIVGGVEGVLVIALGARMVVTEDAFSLGMLFAFISYRTFFSERVVTLTQQLVELKSLQVHLKRVSDIWLTEAESTDNPAPALSARIRPLVLEHVGFSYGDTQGLVLKNIDLRIEPGEFVAITGLSGVGKSTLLRLLMGLSIPTQGRVLVGDHALGPELLPRFRRQLGCVLQEDVFFSGSVAENIALFEAPDEKRMGKVLEQVGLTTVLSQLPMNYHTQIGDIGSQFSSGQMQRLMLARALYRRPLYLFLDEGTANLDAQSAADLGELIRGLSCTRVAITHDQQFAQYADRVLTLTFEGLSEDRASYVG